MFWTFWNKKVPEDLKKDSTAVLQKQIFLLIFRVFGKVWGEWDSPGAREQSKIKGRIFCKMDVRQKGEVFFLCKIGLKTIGVNL